MKKNSILSKRNFMMPVLAAGIFISSCTSHDTNPATTTEMGGDSLMTINTDSMVSDQTRIMPMDTSMHSGMTPTDSMSKAPMDTGSKAATTKTPRKVKISITPATPKTGATSEEVDKEGFYKTTEVLPAYPGGQRALERFFEDNIVYPDAASDNSVEGTVNLTFAVDENGKVFQPMATGQKVGYGIDEEAIRVFSKMPKWTPGKIKGKNVKTRYTLPVRFQLD